MADNIKRITDTSVITKAVDSWLSNKRHTESEFKNMFKSPTLALVSKINDIIDAINKEVLDTKISEDVRVSGALQARTAKNEQDIDLLTKATAEINDMTIKSIEFIGADEYGNNVYSITMKNDTVYKYVAPKGDKGDKGVKGDKGDKGEAGKNGMGVYGFEVVNGNLMLVSAIESNVTHYGINETGHLMVKIN